MKPTTRRLLALVVSLAPVLAHAHPGHDGDHDFGWDFNHLVNHPFATLACMSLLVAAGWGVWRLCKPVRKTKSELVKRR